MILVALKPGQRNTAALALASELAAALGESVVAGAVVIVPAGTPTPLRQGMDDDDFVALLAAGVMSEAQAVLGDALSACRPVQARSVRAGLLELIEQEAADHLVLGSSAGGERGRVNIGDDAQGLLHTASVPVHLAPAGYERGERGLRRVSVALGPGDDSRKALHFGAELAHRLDGLLRTVSFYVRSTATTPFGGGPSYANELSAQWHEQMETTIERAIRSLGELDLPTMWIDRIFGDGSDWDQAMASVEWEPGDLLIVGSRPRGGITNVFLGSKAAEILRHAPVPVAVLPG